MGPTRTVPAWDASTASSDRSPPCSAGDARARRRPRGAPDVEYRPRDDGRPDPGEIVWAWVPYDESDGRGKDRPVLIIGRRAGDLLGLMLSSQDHDRDADDEARHGRIWTDSAPAPGTRAAGRARCGWTGCWCSPRPRSAARARHWTGPASTGWSPRRAASRAGERAAARTQSRSSEGNLLTEQSVARTTARQPATEVHGIELELRPAVAGRPLTSGRTGEP